MSKPGGDPSFGTSSVDVLILTERHPACRRREAQPGSCKERENLAGDAKGKGTSGSNRKERRMLSHREISSRSERLSARLGRCRSGGRMPPVGEITEKTDEDARSNGRPLELIGSPACQRSQISDRWAAE